MRSFEHVKKDHALQEVVATLTSARADTCLLCRRRASARRAYCKRMGSRHNRALGRAAAAAAAAAA
jgi:hypothetical protein